MSTPFPAKSVRSENLYKRVFFYYNVTLVTETMKPHELDFEFKFLCLKVNKCALICLLASRMRNYFDNFSFPPEAERRWAELRNRVTQNDVTLRVANSIIFMWKFFFRVTNLPSLNVKFHFALPTPSLNFYFPTSKLLIEVEKYRI